MTMRLTMIGACVLLTTSGVACGGGASDGGGENATMSGPDAAIDADAARLDSSAPATGPEASISPPDTSVPPSMDDGASPSDDGPLPVSGACPRFASGLNVAWIRFANDIPNPDITEFSSLFQNTYAAGGRVVRWWFHTDGTVTPGYDVNGMASPISSADIAGVKAILDAANAAGVMVNISLWSFDMLQPSANKILSQNQALLQNDTNRQAYIDNVLTPLVTALKQYPGLYSWEIFNEPEGMTTQHGWVPAANRIDESYVQRTVNWLADAIHTADPDARVTNGTWTFTAESTVPAGGQNYYSDSALVSAGGRQGGTLDFYEVHYYTINGSAVSPFTHPATYWNLDKRTIVGEFWALDTDGVSAANLYTAIYDNGYDGAWAWQYENNDNNSTNNTKWPAMQAPMQNLFAAHPADLSCP